MTIHPIVAQYHCPTGNKIIEESFVFISEDLKHDSHAVHYFESIVVKDIINRDVKVDKVIHFSDGCGSQYKGRTSFVDASFAEIDKGVPTEKHFFGSRHGKGPCDREIGVVKRMAKNAVKRRAAIISSANQLFQFGEANLTLPKNEEHSHKKRCFKFVEFGKIDHQRPDRTTNIKTVPGTRQLHCVKGSSCFVVNVKERSCYCKPCITNQGVCENEDFCGTLQQFVMKPKAKITGENY